MNRTIVRSHPLLQIESAHRSKNNENDDRPHSSGISLDFARRHLRRRGGKPHLRIFLNQEEDDLQSGKDLIAPQLAWVPGNTEYKGIFYPPSAPGHYEHPPGIGFKSNSALTFCCFSVKSRRPILPPISTSNSSYL